MVKNETSNEGHAKFDFWHLLYKYGTVFTLGILIVIFTITTGGAFISSNNLLNIFRSMSITAVIALGITFSVSVNGFDLSAGSTVSLSSVLVASMFVWFDMPLIPAILITLSASCVIGLINAFIIIKFKVPDMLATLATMFIIAGMALLYTSGKIVSKNMVMPNGQIAQGELPEAFMKIGQAPTIIIIMIVVLIFAFVFLRYTKHGRYLYAIGGNDIAAELSGVKVVKYKTIAYVLSSFLAGLGGIMLASRMSQANPGAGASYLMEGVAATFIGQSFLGNGKANALGTFVGTLLMISLANGLVMNNVNYYAMDIVKGGVLVLALALTYVKKKK